MDFSSVSVVRPYEQIVKQIQHAIREGQLPRGSKLPTERELADQFGVSRSVVREAIKVLDTMGLVESRQGSGSFIRNSTIESVSRAFVLSVSPDAESVEKLFEFRLGLEVQSAYLAAARRTDEQIEMLNGELIVFQESAGLNDWALFRKFDEQFHQMVAQASGNPYLQVAIAAVRDMQQDVVRLYAKHTGAMSLAISHHAAITDAIARQDSSDAAAQMYAHIEYTAGVVQARADIASKASPEEVAP